ncbi:alcohol acyl transferase 1 allele RGb-like [Ziziphus jujuba]|uniref:Alcohol acyl transferase 1 allele RGb-like n=1 Tax=Ziziphus jujuba TaxID=326968 RepID=A0A6P4AJ74_ZIZJJ|nr:alcohol acyl transferase 1 allele RGb-like [Ziziphus jujuba]
MASKCLEFHVKRCEAELVVPTKPTPNELKYLSDIDDQDFLRFQVHFIWYYRNSPSPLMEGKDPVKVIREALGKALVFYYPLAGRLVEGYNRKLIVDCNGKGVLFIEADADISLHQLGDRIQPPCPFIDQVLYDVLGSDGIIDCPLLLIQVTRLTCGGFILALRINHTTCDAFGVFQFMNTLAEIAKGAQQPSIPPVWERELLFARNPPRVTCIHYEYQQQQPLSIGQPNLDKTSSDIQCSFFFGPKQIRAIQKHLSSHLVSYSRYELLTAFSWRCQTLALELDPEDVVRVSIMVSARGKKYHGLHFPQGYYGNMFSFPAAVSKAGVLCEKPLAYAVDFMAIQGRPPYNAVRGNLIVSDTKNVHLDNVNFGWGLPLYGGLAKTFNGGSIHAKYRKNGEDGILVLMSLPFLAMKRFQEEVAKVIGEDKPIIKILSTL